jgi:hypothetical protein
VPPLVAWFGGPFAPMLWARGQTKHPTTKEKRDPMKTKTLIATAAVALTGAFASSAQAATPTEVTIKGQEGEYFGYVKSSDSDCESDRKVNVYKMVGSLPDRQADKKIGSDISAPNGPDGMYNIGNSGYKKGKFYAHAPKTTDCKGDMSPVITR